MSNVTNLPQHNFAATLRPRFILNDTRRDVFHLFSELPVELQTEIWKLAAKATLRTILVDDIVYPLLEPPVSFRLMRANLSSDIDLMMQLIDLAHACNASREAALDVFRKTYQADIKRYPAYRAQPEAVVEKAGKEVLGRGHIWAESRRRWINTVDRLEGCLFLDFRRKWGPFVQSDKRYRRVRLK